jgi:hypothetical protein
MLYLLHGTDKDKARQKAHELYEGLLKKKPDASLFKIESDNWNSNDFDEKIESQGLFENKFIVFLDNVFQNKEAKEYISKKLAEVADSQNIFIFLEGKIDKATLTKIEKRAAKVQLFEAAKDGDRKFGMGTDKPLSFKDFNIFSLTDVFARREKKALWILFVKAKSFDIPAEEIHGVLFWKLKQMLLNPPSARNFSLPELRSLSAKMVEIYHEAHRGKYELDNALEQMILAL